MNGAVNVPAPILVTHGKQRNALGRCASGVSWRTPVLFSMGGCLQIAVKRRFESVLIRLSRCPLLLDCPASVPRGESSDKGHRDTGSCEPHRSPVNRTALHQVREQFSAYCRRRRHKSLKTTEEWLLFRVLAQVNLALRCNHWYPNCKALSEGLFRQISSSLRRRYSQA